MKIIALITIVFFIGCSQVGIRKSLSPAKKDFDSSLVEQLTHTGENKEGYLSKNGSHLIYLSRERPTHKSVEVYEMDLTGRSEKRLTHNDGVDSCPYYHPSGNWFLYSSSTDEDKENLDSLADSTQNKGEMTHSISIPPKMEIYISARSGASRHRLTKVSGYDSEASYSPDGSNIIFTSNRSGNNELYSYTVRTGHLQRLTFTPEHEGGAFYSPNGTKLVWRAISES